MLELEFSIIEDTLTDTQVVSNLLAEFEAQHKIHIRLQPMTWSHAWQDLFTITMQGKGPDVSQIGSTWNSSLAEMNSLRPFTTREVEFMGGPSAFIPAVWETVVLPGVKYVCAIPWYSYIYCIVYRRDLLASAGLNEESAFGTAEALTKTVHRLQAAGDTIPLLLPSSIQSTDLLHTAASWVWGAGGDFISSDSKHTLFNQPEALNGLKAYFELYRTLAPVARGMDPDQCLQTFAAGKAAIFLTSSDSAQALAQSSIPAVRANLGTAVISRVPWFGGGNLVVWRHTQGYPERERAALALINYLVSRTAQVKHARIDGTLPARLDALPELSLQPASLAQTLKQSVLTGRPYKSVSLWRRMEFQVGQELVQILVDVLAEPTVGIETILHNHLDPLARRLDLTLSL